MAAPFAAAPLPDDGSTDALLGTLLAISPLGILLMRPLYAAPDAAMPVDFAWVQLNPAAQRMLGLAECPAESFLTVYPTAQAAGVFGFYRDAFVSGQVAHRQNLYQHDGLDGYYRLVAQRQGPLLLVTFTDANDEPRSVIEEALRESQAREQAARAEAEAERLQLYQVLQQLPAQVATYAGPDHVFTFVNQRFASFVPAASVLNRPVREAAAGAVSEELFALLDQVYATGETVQAHEVEVQLAPQQAAASRTLFVNASYQPLRDANGHIYGVLDFSYDVTAQVLARRQVEQLNQELETRVQQRTQELAQILTQVPAAIATLAGPEHRFAFANDIYRTIVGDRATVGQSTAEAQPELVAQGFIDLLDRVYRTGEPYLGREIPVQLHDASTQQARTHYVDFSYQPLRDEQGAITGILTFAVDETEKVLARRQADTLQAALLATAQQRVQEREDLYQTFEQAPAAILLLREPDHRIEYVNPAYQQFFPGVALRGHRLAEVHPNVGASGALARLDQVYQSGETYVGQEEPVLLSLEAGQPPETRYFNFTYQPYRENGQTVGVSIFATEATAQALARQQVHDLLAQLQASNADLSQANRQLTRTNVDLDTFVYTASHDLKAPITNIESIVLALRDTLPAAVQQDELTGHLLGLLDHTVGRFLTTIEQLTDLGRLQRVHSEPAELVGLAPAIEAVRLDLVPAIAAAQAQLVVEVPAEVQVSFSPANLRSIVYNLLSNALKYRDPSRPARVWVRAERQPGAVVLTVQDNGLGLSEGQQQRLFGLFQRLHTHVAGTGVGLYMIKRLIDNAGARIEVVSQLGQGSTFTVTFPF